ncbi:MAG: FAD-dependent oxidoreductase [Bdellovibrionaceae bacterium]|nr:FAD-dependent oxidoreductase [Pseudobdellovibrionaceae bacterium]MBX3033983.1 FAD-dependent oxidoreductase [Pseudobdellovibrionaceae bacterium]
MRLDRRHFLRLGLQTGLAYVSFHPLLKAGAQSRLFGAPALDPGPLRAVQGPFTNANFNGEEYTRPHHILWDTEKYIAAKGGRPAVSERREVVVIGGGVSGLCSAFFLQRKNPLVLEQGHHFGGTSQGEVYQNTPFSIGAAYMTVPEAGSTIHRLLQATGALPAARIEKESEARVLVKGAGFRSLWNGEADAKNQQIIARVAADFAGIARSAYPNIPWKTGGLNRRALEQLDGLTFLEWLQQRYGEKLPASLLEYFQVYAWSSFAGSIDEISAAQALNFLTAETEGIMSFPGGNAYVAQSLFQHLQRHLSPDSLRANTMVLDVRADAQGAEVLFEDPQGQLRIVRAKACVVALPKNVASMIVPQMTKEQRQLAQDISYRPYVVANLLLDRRVPSPCFDAFHLEGHVPASPSKSRPPRRPYSDVCFANWSTGDRAPRSVLTLYRPLPYEGARKSLYDGPVFGRLQKEMAATAGEILQALGAGDARVEGLRLTRWGHSLPLAAPGFFAARQDAVFNTPTAGRIFYANQDNALNPSFESACASAETAAARILSG